MAVVYQITLTNGDFLAGIPESAINNQATSLTLVGRGTTEYGERLWNNLVHMLENFASGSQPSNPLTGQLWYDTQTGVVKVYDGANFKSISSVASGSLTNESISSTAAISLAKLQLAPDKAYIVVSQDNKLLEYKLMTGDVTIDKTGATTIQKDIIISLSGDITGSQTQSDLDNWDMATTIANNAVTAAKIASSAITTNKIDSSAVTASKIDSNAVTEAKILDGAVTTNKILASAVTSGQLDSDSVTTPKVADGAITASKIASGAITQAKYGASSIPSTAYQANSVSTSALAGDSVTEDILADDSVTINKLAHGATAAPDYVLSTPDGISLEFKQFSGSNLADFSIEEQKLVHPFLTSDYSSLVAIPFSTEVNTQDLADSMPINIDYGGLT
jgi:hypothetical protein